MSITSLTSARSGNTTTLTAVSSLTPPSSPGAIYFHWYLDGSYVGVSSSGTTTGVRTFVVPPTEQVHVDVLDTIDPDFDPIANAPAGFPAVRTLAWIRSVGATVASYRLEQSISGGAWSSIGTASDDPRRWEFTFLTAALNDLTQYGFRAVPVDVYGNDGTPVTLAAELIVRTPNAPAFTATFDAGTSKVTLAAA